MGKFILVKYGNKYIGGKEPALEEIAGHFDIKDIQPRFNYSLHTEYSYSKRKFDSPHLKDCNEIKKANYNGIPMLWLNENWAKEFAKFIKNLTSGHFYPAVIEIHPPYINYSETVDKFLNIYRVFEEKIVELFPEVKIVIENRFNTMYNKSSFLISKIDDLKKLAELIETNDIKLRIVLDIPQLFSVHNIGLEESRIIRVFEEIKKFRKYISGIHIWGKIKNQGKRAAAHYG
ncbi:MAG: hypothetical protein N3A00_03260, partial [Thermodesulfovibrio sp.]|nr:hypothetical protein [Thermodesulfovibrio sp.]